MIKENKKAGVIIARLLLFGYIILLLSQTVIFRPPQYSYKHYFVPFWSYSAIQQGNNDLILENILNVAIFIPVGFLLCMAIKPAKWWVVLIIGAITSITIESSQFFINRGSAETDDVIHNVLGCLLGYVNFRLWQCQIINEKSINNKNRPI